MLGNYRVAAQLVASRVVLSSTELVCQEKNEWLLEFIKCTLWVFFTVSWADLWPVPHHIVCFWISTCFLATSEVWTTCLLSNSISGVQPDWRECCVICAAYPDLRHSFNHYFLEECLENYVITKTWICNGERHRLQIVWKARITILTEKLRDSNPYLQLFLVFEL
jgi:hypothetical protein